MALNTGKDGAWKYCFVEVAVSEKSQKLVDTLPLFCNSCVKSPTLLMVPDFRDIQPRLCA
jgi:hypothetical protein